MADALYMGTNLSVDPSNKHASLEKMAFAVSEQYSILIPPASDPASRKPYTQSSSGVKLWGFKSNDAIFPHSFSVYIYLVNPFLWSVLEMM